MISGTWEPLLSRSTLSRGADAYQHSNLVHKAPNPSVRTVQRDFPASPLLGSNEEHCFSSGHLIRVQDHLKIVTVKKRRV